MSKKLSAVEKRLKGKPRIAVIHCTASRFGSSFLVNYWHKLREFGTTQHGFQISAGYHYLVTNGHPYTTKREYLELDGQVNLLRDLPIIGAHCRGANEHVGVAFVGGVPTYEQLAGLVNVCRELLGRKEIEGIKGHDEIRQLQGLQPKGCPGIDMNEFRSMVRSA